MRRAALVLTGLLALAGAPACGERAPPARPAAQPAPQLVDQAGRPSSEADLRGKPTLLFFGFTYCPDICPTTLTHLTTLMKALGPQAAGLNVVFVSVDPERDTPAKLHDYMSVFDPRFRAVTGTPEAIARLAKDYDAPFRKVADPGGGYVMQHSPLVYMLDRNAHIVGVMSPDQPDAEALPRLRSLLAS